MDKAPIRSPLHFDSLGTSALDRPFVRRRVDTAHQSVPANTDTHLAVHHERDAAEHLPFGHSRYVRECHSHSVDQGFTRCHGMSTRSGSAPPPNGMRLSCGAVLWCSQMEFYYWHRAPPASGAC